MQVMGPARLCRGIRGQLWMLSGRLTLPTQEEQGTWPQESQGRKGTKVPPPPFLKLRGLSLHTEANT